MAYRQFLLVMKGADPRVDMPWDFPLTVGDPAHPFGRFLVWHSVSP
jgi:hypothetical protein